MNTKHVQKVLLVILFLALVPMITVATHAAADDPTPLTAEFPVNSHTPNDQIFSAVAADDEGNFVVTWMSRGQDTPNQDEHGIYAQRFNSAAQPQGPEFLVNTTTEGSQVLPRIAMDPEGNFVIVWRTASNGRLSAQRFDNQGNPLGNELTIDNGAFDGHDVAMNDDGKFVVVWSDQNYVDGEYLRRVTAQSFSSTGVPQWAAFQVDPNATVPEQVNPAVGMDNQGGFAVAWSDWSEIQGRVFTALGLPITNTFRVNNAVRDNQYEPEVAMAANGDFVVTWYRYGSVAVGGDVYARAFAGNGNPKDKQFLVNTYKLDWQWLPAIAMDLAGNFIITWPSFGQDGSFDGVYAQQYNNLSKRVGSEFLVNITTEQSQYAPAVALTDNGRFVVTWNSGDGGFDGVFGRLYQSVFGGSPIYASLNGSGSVSGTPYQPGDILVFDPASAAWAMHFDASDLGLNNNLAAFDVQPNGNLLLTLQSAQSIAGLGTVSPNDIVQFTPTSLGEQTAGTFAWYFDGSDVGLSTSAERIDTITLDPTGKLLISTTGSVTVPGVNAVDEDLLKFTSTSLGENTAGSWQLYFDGSDEGLSKDLVGAWVDPASGDLYLNFEQTVNLDGSTINALSIARCEPVSLGTNTNVQCELHWDGSNLGLAGKQLNGISLSSP